MPCPFLTDGDDFMGILYLVKFDKFKRKSNSIWKLRVSSWVMALWKNCCLYAFDFQKEL